MRIFKLALVIIVLGTQFTYNSANELPIREYNSMTDGTLRRIRIPILMYHYVSTLPEGADAIRTNLTVPPALFEAHLRYLQTSGYQPISLYEMDKALNYGTVLPTKPVVLTFDDGHIDHYDIVLPLLQQYNFTGTFFVITEFADQSNPAHLNWTQIREMSEAGMSIEPHTKTHSELTERDHDFLVYEILGSIESVTAYTTQTPSAFAYPVGRYDAATLRVMGTTNIRRAVTTQFGLYQTTSNRYEVPRIRISNDTSVIGLQYLLSS